MEGRAGSGREERLEERGRRTRGLRLPGRGRFARRASAATNSARGRHGEGLRRRNSWVSRQIVSPRDTFVGHLPERNPTDATGPPLLHDPTEPRGVPPDSPGVATTPRPSARGCPEGMAFIPAGEFDIGDDVRRSHDPLPRRRAQVERGFCVERAEVSVEAFRRCVAAGVCAQPVAFVNTTGDSRRLCNWNRPDAERHPVNCVIHAQARAYCGWTAHPGGPRRLPREVEWEFAARGTAGRGFAWGDEPGPAVRANFCGAECETFAHGIDIPEVVALPGWTDPFPMTAPVDALPRGGDTRGGSQPHRQRQRVGRRRLRGPTDARIGAHAERAGASKDRARGVVLHPRAAEHPGDRAHPRGADVGRSMDRVPLCARRGLSAPRPRPVRGVDPWRP